MMRSAVGAFCLGTNLVDRRRLRLVEVFLAVVVECECVVLLLELDGREELLVCFLALEARCAHAGMQIATHTKTNRYFRILNGTLSTEPNDARLLALQPGGPFPYESLHPRTPRLNPPMPRARRIRQPAARTRGRPQQFVHIRALERLVVHQGRRNAVEFQPPSAQYT